MQTFHRKTPPAIFTLLVVACSGISSQTTPAGTLDPAFPRKAMEHVRHLSALGPRLAGSPGESKAAGYLRERMEALGLEVRLEPFRILAFQLESSFLKSGEESAQIIRLGFNPFVDSQSISGELAFVENTANPGEVLETVLDGKIVVTTGRANVMLLALFKQPAALAVVSDADFQRLRAAKIQSGEVLTRGRHAELTSANVVGVLRSRAGSGKGIVLSAHLDSGSGPGASDNASGIGVLLELARHYISLPQGPGVTMRFVAFGAEEMGMVGARSYLDLHAEELRNCLLLFNIDTVGGSGTVFTDTRGGVRNIPPGVQSQFRESFRERAMSDHEGRWFLLGPELRALFDSSNVPPWLRDAVTEAAGVLGREVMAANGMGSDHRVFIQAGVVATNIGISGSETHTADDVPERVNEASLETAGRIVSQVADRIAREPK